MRLFDRRSVVGSAALGAIALSCPITPSVARPRPFDRAAYDRYVALFNAADPRFTDYYAEDVEFLIFGKGKAAVLRFYARQRPNVRESLEVVFFCADSQGAAAEVRGTFRCIKDCEDPSLFGRPLKTGEVQRTHGYLIYNLNEEGKILRISGPAPEIVEPWHTEI